LPEAEPEAEADSRDPWVVVPADDGWAVYRAQEAAALARVELPPAAWFEHRGHALFCAAVLGPLAREPRFRLSPQEQPHGYALEVIRGGGRETVGWLAVDQPEVVEAMDLAQGLVRSPQTLAHQMTGAGPTATALGLELCARRLCLPGPCGPVPGTPAERPQNPPDLSRRLWEPGEDNPLSPEFLCLLATSDGSSTEAEAESFGPWAVVPAGDGGWAVHRDWEAPGRPGDGPPPAGWFKHRRHALLYAAVLAPTFREPLFHLCEEPQPEGHALETVYGDGWVETVGWLTRYEPRVAEGMHLAEGLARSPQALASLLEAAGPAVLERAVILMGRRLCEERHAWRQEVRRVQRQAQAAEGSAGPEETP
jgi:hypothetical protein